jgi:hypothetical protein
MDRNNLSLFFLWCWLQVLHKEKVVKACKRRYHERHHAEVLERSRRWQVENKIRRRVTMRDWCARKQATDSNWVIRKNLATRLWWALRAKVCGSTNVLKLIGCSLPELRSHLQNQFLPGMSWDNYGEWHIDHIRPCASFDLTKPEQQRECFNYRNLQPLWAVDNLKKGAKIASGTRN